MEVEGKVIVTENSKDSVELLKCNILYISTPFYIKVICYFTQLLSM